MGNNIIMSKVFEDQDPVHCNHSDWLQTCENISGFDTDLISRPISRGKAPIVFDTINTAAIITIYLQKLFFPVNDDSRWFIVRMIDQNSEIALLG